MSFQIKKNTGYSLIEVIIYLSLLTVMFAVIVMSLGALLRHYQKIKAIRQVENSALASFDRIIRDIRQSESIDTGSSSFDTTNGVLSLLNNASSTRFYISGGKISVDEDGKVIGPLTGSNVTVTSLVFRQISTTTSEAVKIEAIFTSKTSSTTYNFYDTAVLRGSYE